MRGVRAEGGDGVQEELGAALEVARGQREERLVHLEPVLALPVAALLAQGARPRDARLHLRPPLPRDVQPVRAMRKFKESKIFFLNLRDHGGLVDGPEFKGLGTQPQLRPHGHYYQCHHAPAVAQAPSAQFGANFVSAELCLQKRMAWGTQGSNDSA